MAEFINKAKNDNNFNNYSRTTKAGGGAQFDVQQNNPSALPEVNNKERLETQTNINTQRSGAAAAQQASIDPNTGYPPCPDGQTRVAWPTDFALDPIPNNSNNWSRMSACGCWVDTNLSFGDILPLAGLDAIWAALGKGKNLTKVTVDGLIAQSKLKNVFSQFALRIKSNRAYIAQLEDSNRNIRQLIQRLPDKIASAQNSINRLTKTRVGINDARVAKRQEIYDLQQELSKYYTDLAKRVDEYVDPITGIPWKEPGLKIDDYSAIPIDRTLPPMLKKFINGYNNAKIRTENAIGKLEPQIAVLDAKYNDITNSINIAEQELAAIQNLNNTYKATIAENNRLKGVTQSLIDQDIAAEAAEEARIIAEANAQYLSMSALQKLQTALPYIGVSASVLLGMMSRRKICVGQNTKLNEKTCECECVPDTYQECPATQNPVSGGIIDNFVPLVPQTSESISCFPPCCGGQVAYQFGSDPCDCACLGDLIFGTPVGGGGPADGTWIAGEGCDCLNGSSRGKCVSADLKNKAIAQGKRWNGAICDFECPGGPPADCVGNATRPPKINYGGILIDDECGACVCDGDSFSCNTDEGYVKDTSPGVCDCVYDPVTTENIYLVP